MTSPVILVPWTTEQVTNLNAYQTLRTFHPYTCGADFCTGVLLATTDGWRCGDCAFTQGWAYAFSAQDWSDE